MSPMAFTALLLLLVLGAGSGVVITTETTTEMTTTDTTTTETTTTDTTTTETTTKTTKMIPLPAITALNRVVSKSTSGNGTLTSVLPRATAFPAAGNTTNFQSGNSSTGSAAANSTAAPSYLPSIPSVVISPHANTTTNGSSVAPTSSAGGGVVMPTSSTKGNRSSTLAVPTRRPSVPAEGSTAPRQTPPDVQGSSSRPKPSKAAALRPTTVQLLLRVPLSFRILNRSFNETLRDAASKDYRRLQYAVLTVFQRVFGCAGCVGRQSYKGCSELRFSQGSVEVQSTLVFGHGNGTVTSDAVEQQLRNSLDRNGFVMDLQLASIRSSTEVMSPAPAPAVPDWAIALLVLVCILLLLSILTCLLMTTCTCRRKSRGKLDLLSTKDSYHPMAEYAPYQSHGRYVSPSSKPNPYSQVAGSNSAGTGTFTYTNPAAASDNL